MRTQRPRDMTPCAQGHALGKWQSQNPNPQSLPFPLQLPLPCSVLLVDSSSPSRRKKMLLYNQCILSMAFESIKSAKTVSSLQCFRGSGVWVSSLLRCSFFLICYTKITNCVFRAPSHVQLFGDTCTVLNPVDLCWPHFLQWHISSTRLVAVFGRQTFKTRVGK